MVNPKQLPASYLSLGDLLLKPIDDPAVVALGYKPPWPGFIDLYKPMLGGNSPSLLQALLPFPQYGSVTLGPNSGGVPSGSSPTGNSTYHSFQMKLTKQAAQGLFLLTSFTWSKKITDADSNWGGFNGTSARDTYNRQLEKAVSPSNPPYRLTTAFNYELPVGPGKKFANTGGAAGKVLGGWQFNGILTYQTGIPIQVVFPNLLPLNNFKNYPNMSLAQLEAELIHINPIDRLAPLAAHGIRILHVHGNLDHTVPLEPNSEELMRRYRALGGTVEIEVVQGKGHGPDPAFYQSDRALRFLLE